MTDDKEFRIRPGRIRSTRTQQARPFISQLLAGVEKAGGRVNRSGQIVRGRRSRFGKGQAATIAARQQINARSRGAVIKARLVRNRGKAAQLGSHLDYLQRDGVTRDGAEAGLFGSAGQEIEATDFAERCQGDRHHFRFIVSPDDPLEMADLRSFTSDLVAQMETDLGTRLDWTAVDHWNTEHPHVHLIVRGIRDDGENLVISRDYISEGMRDRARAIITDELGPRTDLDIRQSIERQIGVERWTQLDRQMQRDQDRHGIIDVAPVPGRTPDAMDVAKVGRLRKLETLGLASQIGAGQWILADQAENTLRELGERGDIIKRMHRALGERGIERGSASFVLAGESIDQPVIGRLVARGLDDELKGSAYAIVDGTDGRTHHIRLPDLEATSDAAPGAIVELRAFDDARGDCRMALAVRSDIDINRQVTAIGATWLDRQSISRDQPLLSDGGFGAEVRDAMERRALHLVGEGLAEQRGRRIIFAAQLLDTLRQRELDLLAGRIAGETGLPHNPSQPGEHVSGSYQRRIALASGRFAMIGNGFGFQLVPWSPALERHLGREVSGIMRDSGRIDWSFARKRELGL
jgi:type IV secretory pathway VirD2 relaxase